jgi:hypothetical protein
VPLFEQFGFAWSTKMVVGAARTAEPATAHETATASAA